MLSNIKKIFILINQKYSLKTARLRNILDTCFVHPQWIIFDFKIIPLTLFKEFYNFTKEKYKFAYQSISRSIEIYNKRGLFLRFFFWKFLISKFLFVVSSNSPVYVKQGNIGAYSAYIDNILSMLNFFKMLIVNSQLSIKNWQLR